MIVFSTRVIVIQFLFNKKETKKKKDKPTFHHFINQMSILDIIGTGTDKIMFCPVILTKGKRKNLSCNRKIIENTSNGSFCKFHTVKSEPISYCSVILTKGERKNQTCNRKSLHLDTKMCKIHTTLEERRPYNPYVDKEYNVQIEDNYTVSFEIYKSNDIKKNKNNNDDYNDDKEKPEIEKCSEIDIKPRKMTLNMHKMNSSLLSAIQCVSCNN